MNLDSDNHFTQLALEIKQLGKELGFNQVAITDINLTTEFDHLKTWLQTDFQGDMNYFTKYLDVYEHPEKLLLDTTRIICCSINYPQLGSSSQPIASFATIQDYSHYLRELLKKYVNQILILLPEAKTRVFAGNAPILEKALAAKAGIGWYGKNSLLLNQNFGSLFFLGEILINIPLPIDKPVLGRCGNCFKCKDNCPTQAIIAPYQLNAKRCISYLTIEHKGSIPLELRPLIGTKIFGCDSCQQVCPWNNQKTMQLSTPFTPLSALTSNNLVDWFLWSEQEFLNKTKNSPINRLGHERWLRNIAVALGNSAPCEKIRTALQARLDHPSPLVREHVEWATQTYSLIQR